jgi:ABC-type nitrate/sulfonate/bicarbonate transport system substrate-binding protein
MIGFMGADNGFLHLVSVPEITKVQDLKGKTLSVDARTTGFAFALEKMLERNGLRDTDYTLVKAGGVLQRFQALMKKEHAGTLLISPFEVMAEAQGFHDLGAAIDLFGHYQGLVGAAQRSWLKTHRAETVGFIRGYVAGLDWLYNPENKEGAIALLRENLPQMTPEIAAKTYAVLLDRRTGFFPKAGIDIAGIKTVLALRSEYGEPKKKLTNPAKYYDLTYYSQAIKR